MAINEETKQLSIAVELETLTRTLVHSTRTVSNPQDSYSLLGELRASVEHLAQVCEQFANWHKRTVDGTHYAGEDGERNDSAYRAGCDLMDTANALGVASAALERAHSKSAVVRWYSDPK